VWQVAWPRVAGPEWPCGANAAANELQHRGGELLSVYHTPWRDAQRPAGKPMTVPKVRAARRRNEKLVCITAYDAPTAQLVDAAGVDLVLVGDSLATVVQGRSDTLAVTLDEMIYHAKLVRGGLQRALLVVDLPFGSFQQGPEATLAAAIRVLKESGAAAVKLEGGARVVASVEACTRQDIPVLGHLGLTPQSVHALGGFRKQAKHDEAVRQLVADARALADAGVFALVLECVPSGAAQAVRDAVDVPVIGIGAGGGLDGQILVFHDLVGLLPQSPSFVRRFAELGQSTLAAVAEYGQAVRGGTFPE